MSRWEVGVVGVSIISTRVQKAAQLGYRVDDVGIVYSPHGRPIRTTMGRGKSWHLRFFAARIDPESRSVFKIPVHRLAAYQRYGEAALARGVVAFHDDGDTLNCAPSNIVIGTRTDRVMRIPAEARREHGRRGAEATRKLTDDQVMELRRRWAEWEPIRSLAHAFGISKGSVSYIANGRTYTHLPMVKREKVDRGSSRD